MRTILSSTEGNAAKHRFLLSLTRDLRAFGFSAIAKRTRRRIHFRAKVAPIRGRKARIVLEALRRRQLESAAEFIEEMERHGVLDLFIDGNNLRIDRISPTIRFCENSRELNIYNYCRLLQAVPSAGRIGRQIRVLVYDEGQDHPVLMGAIGLASSLYTVGARDRRLGWSQKDSLRKNLSLRQVMDLAVCISFPPYSELLGGKLMALLAMSEAIAQKHLEKYGSALLALFTTCATGIHCAIFNRIMVRRGGLYRRIGETVGFTAVLYRRETLRMARSLLDARQRRMRRGQLLPHLRPIRILKTAMRECGIPPDPFLNLGIRKGIYIGYLSEDHLQYLKTGKRPTVLERLAFPTAVEHWRHNLLPRRAGRSDVLSRIAQFKSERLALSTQLAGC